MNVGVGLRFRFLVEPSSTEATASLSALLPLGGMYDVDGIGGGGDADALYPPLDRRCSVLSMALIFSSCSRSMPSR